MTLKICQCGTDTPTQGHYMREKAPLKLFFVPNRRDIGTMGDAICHNKIYATIKYTGPRSTVGNVSGNRCESDCRSRGREFDPGPVPYFRGD